MYIDLRGLQGDFDNYDYYECPFEYSRFFGNPVQNCAIAYVKGGSLYPQINGVVRFTDVSGGVNVEVEIDGLPAYKPAGANGQPIGPFGFHIHSGGSCSGDTPSKPFPNADGHFNPYNQPHGNHAGDFPVIFSNNGLSKMTFFTNKFSVQDILGKTVIIHENPDDYRSQPSGNSGRMIACGEIVECMG